MPRGVIRVRRFFWLYQRETAHGKARIRWWEAGMEKRAANRCQAWIKSSHIADVRHPPRPRPMDAVFCSVAQSRFDPAVQVMTCSLSIALSAPSFLRKGRRQIIEGDQNNDHRTSRLF